MKIKVDIFSGFLGAGKTTLIKKLIEESLHKEQIVMIENEFGEIGIDGAILKKSSLAVKEINAGCICCTVVGDFQKAIQEAIEQYTPTRIIIEPSGVGKLSEVLRACKGAEISKKIEINMIITVVDALKYNMYIRNFAEFYKDQIANSKTIVLSRTQKLHGDPIQSVEESMRKLNPKANIITTPWALLKGERIVEVGEQKAEAMEESLGVGRSPVARGRALVRAEKVVHYHADEVFQTWGVETGRIFSRKQIEENLRKIEEGNTYGLVLRAKGILPVDGQQWIQFDYVPGEIELKKIDPDYTGRVCVIGRELNQKAIETLFLG